MANEQRRKFTRKRHYKDDKINRRQIGNNRRLGPIAANRHLKQRLSARQSPRIRGLRGINYESQGQPRTTREKLWDVWTSIKLLFTQGGDPSTTPSSSSLYRHHYHSSVEPHGLSREDSSRSTIDTSLEYMPVQQENGAIPEEPTTNTATTGIETETNKIDPREATISRLREQVALLKKKVKYAREKNVLYKSLLDEANIGTTYLESRRHIKNLVRDNMKPESELPPSPERKVYPLVTSSPIRQPQGSTTNSTTALPSSSHGKMPSTAPPAAPPQLKSYYNKYPKLPHTESLAKRDSPPVTTNATTTTTAAAAAATTTIEDNDADKKHQ